MSIQTAQSQDLLASVSVQERQDPLIALYHHDPTTAQISDRAKTVGGTETDPFHGNVVLGRDELGVVLPFGIHHAVGGDHDAPNPGDLLCAALATCVDSTLRILAERLRIGLRRLEVEVTADVDLRGTLLVSKDVPVAFQSMRLRILGETDADTPDAKRQKWIAAAEHSCINLQTLLAGIQVETEYQAS